MATEGEAVRAVAWFRDGRWWAVGKREDRTYTDTVDLGITTVGAARVTRKTAQVFGVPPSAVVLVAASFAPDQGDPADAGTASAYGLRSEETAGEELDRVATLAEIAEEWVDLHEPMPDALDRLATMLPLLGAPPLTDDERAAVVARIEG